MDKSTPKHIHIDATTQTLVATLDQQVWMRCDISTGLRGLGEKLDSGCTPRGKHQVHAVIGTECPENSVFIAREWTGEIYDSALASKFPDRDWILTRIIQLDGLEPGFNQGGDVDTLNRYIYIHGTPDTTALGKPGSKGCIRMRNQDIIQLANWIDVGSIVFIEG